MYQPRRNQKSRELVLPDKWVPGWQGFEAKIREHQGRYFLVALAIGYLLQALLSEPF